jgi:hypothetical protein
MPLRVVLCVLLLGPALTLVIASKLRTTGIDFYHFWLPAQARAASPTPLHSPYAESAQYAAVINARADALWARFGVPRQAVEQVAAALAAPQPSDHTQALLANAMRGLGPAQQRELVDANRFLLANLRRRAIDLTAPPLLYAMFAFLPAGYDRATALYGMLQLLCVVLGTALIWRAAGGATGAGVLVALALLAVFTPLKDDLQVGNFNCLHLALLALPLALTAKLRAERGRTTWAALCLSLLALYVLLKPNLALLGAGVAAHVVATTPARAAARALAVAAAVAAALLLWPCLYFDSFAVWNDWLAYVGGDPGKLAYDLEKFNVSWPLHCARWFGGTALVYSLLGGTALLLAAALVLRHARRAAGLGWRACARAALATPFAPASLGLVVTLAISPLVWSHYTLALVVPVAWLLSRRARIDLDSWLLAIAAVLYGLSYLAGLQGLGLVDAADSAELGRSLAALAWIPLAGAVLRALHAEVIDCARPGSTP